MVSKKIALQHFRALRSFQLAPQNLFPCQKYFSETKTLKPWSILKLHLLTVIIPPLTHLTRSSPVLAPSTLPMAGGGHDQYMLHTHCSIR